MTTKAAAVAVAPRPAPDAEFMGDSGGNVVEALARAEIDVQVATARRFPRGTVKAFRERVLELATVDPDVAASCFYVLPRDGKSIEGASIRFAEIIAAAWRNLVYGGRVIEESDRFITVQGSAIDLETNVRAFGEVRRRIQTKGGKRYTDDMVAMTCNAGISIACRNAILHVVPRALWEGAYDQAKRLARGDEKTLEVRRTAMFAYFTREMRIPADRLFARLSTDERPVAKLEDITITDVEMLLGIRTAIKDGDTTAEEAFGLVAADPGEKRDEAAEKLAASLAETAKGTPASGPSPKAADAAAATTTADGATGQLALGGGTPRDPGQEG